MVGQLIVSLRGLVINSHGVGRGARSRTCIGGGEVRIFCGFCGGDRQTDRHLVAVLTLNGGVALAAITAGHAVRIVGTGRLQTQQRGALQTRPVEQVLSGLAGQAQSISAGYAKGVDRAAIKQRTPASVRRIPATALKTIPRASANPAVGRTCQTGRSRGVEVVPQRAGGTCDKIRAYFAVSQTPRADSSQHEVVILAGLHGSDGAGGHPRAAGQARPRVGQVQSVVAGRTDRPAGAHRASVRAFQALIVGEVVFADTLGADDGVETGQTTRAAGEALTGVEVQVFVVAETLLVGGEG